MSEENKETAAGKTAKSAKSAKSEAAEVVPVTTLAVTDLTDEEAEALTQEVLQVAAYGVSQQAYEWDPEPCLYVAPGRVNRSELDFRINMRRKFSPLNVNAKQQASQQYEDDIKAMAFSERAEADYRRSNPFWEVPAPPPLGVLADSRDVRGSGQVAPLPPGFERRAPAA